MIGSQESKENKRRVDGPIGYVVRSGGRQNRRLKQATLWDSKAKKCENVSSYHQIRNYRHIKNNIKIKNVIQMFHFHS
jgi:hypothetical protein